MGREMGDAAATGALPAALAQKLAHRLREVRCRALDSAAFKLDSGLATPADAVACTGFLEALMEWYNFADCTRHCDVAQLLTSLAADEACKARLAELGAVEFFAAVREDLRDEVPALPMELDALQEAMMRAPVCGSPTASEVPLADDLRTGPAADSATPPSVAPDDGEAAGGDDAQVEAAGAANVPPLPHPGDAAALAAAGLFGEAERAEYARGRAAAAEARAGVSGTGDGGVPWGLCLRAPPVAPEDAQALFEINLRLEHAADADVALRVLTELKDRASVDCMAGAVLARKALVRNVSACLHATSGSGLPALAATALAAVLRSAARALALAQDGSFDVSLPAAPAPSNEAGESRHTPGTVDFPRSYPTPPLEMVGSDGEWVDVSEAAHIVAHHALGALHTATRNQELLPLLAVAVPLLGVKDEDIITKGDARGKLVLQASARFKGYFEALSSAAEVAERDVDAGGTDAIARALTRVLSVAAAFLELLEPEVAAVTVPAPLAGRIARASFTGAMQMSRPKLAARLRPYAAAADPAAAAAFALASEAAAALESLEDAAAHLREVADIGSDAKVDVPAALEAIARAVPKLGAAPKPAEAALRTQALLIQAAALGSDAALEAAGATASLVSHNSNEVRAAALGVLAAKVEAEVAASAATGGERPIASAVLMLPSPQLLDALACSALHCEVEDVAANAARCLLAAAQGTAEGRAGIVDRAPWIACAARAGSAAASAAGSAMGSLSALIEGAAMDAPFYGSSAARNDLAQLAPALRALFSVDSACRARAAAAVIDVAQGGASAKDAAADAEVEWRGAAARAVTLAEAANLSDVVADPLGAALAAGYEPDRPYGMPGTVYRSRASGSCANAPDLARVAGNLNIGGNVRAAAAEQLIALSHDPRLEPILSDDTLLEPLLRECSSGESWGGAARASAAGLLASAVGASSVARQWLARDGRLLQLVPLVFHASMAVRRAAGAAIAYIVFDPRALGLAGADSLVPDGVPAHMIALPGPFANAYKLPCEVKVTGDAGATSGSADFDAARELVASLVLFSGSARKALESLQSACDTAVDGAVGSMSSLDVSIISALHVDVAPRAFKEALGRAAGHSEAMAQIAIARDTCSSCEGASGWLAAGAGEALARFLSVVPATSADRALLIEVLALAEQLLVAAPPGDVPTGFVAMLTSAVRAAFCPIVDACCHALVKQDSASLDAATGVPSSLVVVTQQCMRVLAALSGVVAARGASREASALAATVCTSDNPESRSLLEMLVDSIIPWRDSTEWRTKQDAACYGLRVLAIRFICALAPVAAAAGSIDAMDVVAKSSASLVTCVAVERRERPVGLRGRGAVHSSLDALLTIASTCSKDVWAQSIAASGGTYWLSRACRDPWAPARCTSHALLAALASCDASRALVERSWPEAGQCALLASLDVRECAAVRGAALRCVAAMLEQRAAAGVEDPEELPGRRPHDLAAGLARSLQLWEVAAAATNERSAQAPCVLRGACEALARAVLATDTLDEAACGPLPAADQTWPVLLRALSVPSAAEEGDEDAGALLAHVAFPGPHAADACGAISAVYELMCIAAARSESHRQVLRACGGALVAAGVLAALAAAGGLAQDPAAEAERAAAAASASSALAMLTGDKSAPWWQGPDGRQLASAALAGVSRLLKAPSVTSNAEIVASVCRGAAALLATPAEAAAALGKGDRHGAQLAMDLLTIVNSAGEESPTGAAALSCLRSLIAHSGAAKGATIDAGLHTALAAQALAAREAWTLSGGVGAGANRRAQLLAGATRATSLLRHLALGSRRGADAAAAAGAARVVVSLWPVARSAAACASGTSDGGALRLELIALVANVAASGGSGARRALAAGNNNGALGLAVGPAADAKSPAALIKASLRAAHCAAAGSETRAVLGSPKSVVLAACGRIIGEAYPSSTDVALATRKPASVKSSGKKRQEGVVVGTASAVRLAEQALLTLAAIAAHADGASAVLRGPKLCGLVQLACVAARAPAEGGKGAASRRAAAAAVALLRNCAFVSEAKAHFVSSGGGPLRVLIQVAGDRTGGAYTAAARAHAASALWALVHNGQKVIAMLHSMGEGTRDALRAAEHRARAEAIAMAAEGGDPSAARGAAEAVAGAGALLSHAAACLACVNVHVQIAHGFDLNKQASAMAL